ncbi:hypothetical protein D3C76_1415910 [compost metagenome]
MLPQLKRRKAGAVGSNGRLHSVFVHRVFGAVFIAGQVMAATVQEAVNAVRQAQGWCQRVLQGLGAQ